jgi:uroporphyrinogen-III synthase
MNPQLPLAGVGVLVTRPARQADELCALIEAAGGRAVRFPTLAISAVPDAAAARAALAALENYDLVVFISANAVEQAMALRPAADWPAGLRSAALGAGTARALARHGLPPLLLAPPPHDSEALLSLPQLQELSGQRILIIRGVGGRELLGETLRARGAAVIYAEVYQRTRPDADTRDILAAWAQGAIDIVIVTSGEALRNLVAMLGESGRARLLVTPLVVVSGRMVQQALALGFINPRLAETAGDAALMTALIAWRHATTAGESG